MCIKSKNGTEKKGKNVNAHRVRAMSDLDPHWVSQIVDGDVHHAARHYVADQFIFFLFLKNTSC